MLDQDTDTDTADVDTAAQAPAAPGRIRRRAASRPTGPPVEPPDAAVTSPTGTDADAVVADAGAAEPLAAPPRRRTRKKSAAPPPADPAPTATGADSGSDPSPLADESSMPTDGTAAPVAKKATKRAPTKRATKKTAAPPTPSDEDSAVAGGTDPRPPADAAANDTTSDPAGDPGQSAESTLPAAAGLFSAVEKPTPARRRRSTRSAATPEPAPAEPSSAADAGIADAGIADAGTASPPAVPLFQPADPATAPPRRTRTRKPAVDPVDDSDPAAAEPVAGTQTDTSTDTSTDTDDADSEPDGSGDDTDSGEGSGTRRRRRRGGRRRRKSGDPADASTVQDDEGSAEDPTPTPSEPAPGKPDTPAVDDSDDDAEGSSTRRRRRRRRKGEPSDPVDDDPQNTVVKVRERRQAESEITSVGGSTRLEAKRQRRRDGREASRRRPPILSESEFLSRRESVQRQMVVRQRADLTQIAVLEDNVLVEHYVARESQTSLIGNVYLGRVQNVLPSMEAAFIDIGKGRNAVLYAGEVDWSALGMDGKPRRIEEALSSGQHVLVQVSKDPVDHKGARLTAQVSLPGRFLVYVPNGHTSGISRKLPEGERARLKGLLKDVVPSDAGVIIRTAAEGATEDQLTRDIGALTARWDDIAAKVKDKGQGPKLLYGEPDLMIKVVRDLFTEDFASLVVQGDDAWDDIIAYVGHVAPDLADRCQRYDGDSDAFGAYRVDEQIAKALDRKVFLPSGGSLVIDRTEAMTVVDVNTGKFTGSGGNLEETVTKNNLEAAEEIVRQLRLRDIGGIIVVDFIDMVLESNRDLVLRRMIECLSRDRTRHQVAEVTSLGLVQMTRKKIGTGLVEAFSQPCPHCDGRGLLLHAEPVETGDDSDGGAGQTSGGRRGADQDGRKAGSRRRGGRTRGGAESVQDGPADVPGEPADATADTPTDVVDAAEFAVPADVAVPADEADMQPADPTGDNPEVGAEVGAAVGTAVGTEVDTGVDTAGRPSPAPTPPRPTLDQPSAPDLPEAITPKKKTPRRRVTRKTAPPEPATDAEHQPRPAPAVS